MVARLDTISIFPAMFEGLKNWGITARALKNKLWAHENFNPRDFATNNYQHIDDRPYGGGAGMVMMAEPLDLAIQQARAFQQRQGVQKNRVVYLSAQGRVFNQQKTLDFLDFLQQNGGLIFLCGRYEGVDERLLKSSVDEELSLGDFVLSGGELAAMAVMDSLIRQLPGALNSPTSLKEESFSAGAGKMLEYPQYTRPEVFKGMRVPEILLSGNHAEIARWRENQARQRTKERRPDLFISNGIVD